jgi:hypothetical protein
MNQGDKLADEQWLDMARDNPDDFGQVLAGKLKDLTGTGIGPACNLHYSNVRIAYTHLYGFDMEGVGANASLVTRSGNQGSIAELRVPASAGLLRKAFNIVVGPELTWSAVATTTDYASEAQAVTARNSLEYYWKHEMMGVQCKAAQFEAMAFAESALHIPWDTNSGKEMGVDMQTDPNRPRIIRGGDMRFARIPTWDIFRDPTAHSRESLTYVIVREWPDKFDTAATCDTEEKRQACMTSGASPPSAQAWLPFRVTYDSNTKRIPVYYLYALRSPSVPQGRQTVFLENGTVLSDGPLDERYVNLTGTIGAVVWTTSGSYAGTPWPYTKWFGTLGSDQARDGLRRDLLTNATATSGNVIAVPSSMMDAGAAVAFESGGPQLIPIPEGSTGEIKVLQLQQSHPEHFKLLQTLGSEEQQIMGIDQLTGGNLDAMPASGALAALMTSTSVQNNSQEQSAFVDLATRVGNLVLRHIQKMPQPKRIALAGNARSALVTTTEVSGTQVAGIERVMGTMGSPMQQTDAGRYQIATEALKNKWVKTPEQFQTVLDTGRLDALTEDLSNELLLIKGENEALSRGEDVKVMLEDDHRLHLKGHPAVMASLRARQDPKVVAALQAHDDAHLRMLREADPELLKAMGQEPLAPAAPQTGTPPPMGGQPAQPQRPPQAQQQAQAPSMPTNPQTGQKAAPAGGSQPPALAIRPS